MVGMAALQVFVVRFFFQGARKGKQLFAMLLEMSFRLEYGKVELTYSGYV